MEKLIFKNALVSGILTDIEVTDGKFTKIGNISEDGTDLGGNEVYPGLIDLHCHGCLGNDAYSGFDKLSEMSVFMAKNGVTCWYPTIGNIQWDRFEKAMNEDFEGLPGACIPGYHLEGPYISEQALGSGLGSNTRTPLTQKIPHLEKVKLMNVAPEVEGVLDFIKENPDIRFAIGHTNADYDTAKTAIDAGANHAVHLYNSPSKFTS